MNNIFEKHDPRASKYSAGEGSKLLWYKTVKLFQKHSIDENFTWVMKH